MEEMILREIEIQRHGGRGRMILKMNALEDGPIIKLLYQASQAGVATDLIIRGACCLRPQHPGVSENIHVRSVLGRFLEHSRIFYFENGNSPEVYVGSADWMDRNLSRRVEVVFPIEQPELKQRVIDVLRLTLADTAKARELLPDGTYRRVAPLEGQAPLRSQTRFLEQANEPPPPPPTAPTATKPNRRTRGRR